MTNVKDMPEAGAASQTIPYFDCDTFLGRSFGGPGTRGTITSPSTLIAEMDRLGIQKAAVYHILAKEYHPPIGNSRLLDETSGRDRIEPVWVVMPHHTGEVPEPQELVRQMSREGVRLARAFPAWSPQAHRFSLAEWCAGELLAGLEGARIPLELDFNLFRRQEPPWADIFEVCTNHPDLPVILMGVQGRNNRTLYPLLKRCANLYIQTSGLNVHRGLEDFCATFGAERLVFGSGYPVQSLGAARFQLERGGLTERQQRMVAYENMDSLLRGAGGNTEGVADDGI